MFLVLDVSLNTAILVEWNSFREAIYALFETDVTKGINCQLATGLLHLYNACTSCSGHLAIFLLTLVQLKKLEK